jgi:hypothetical protein
MTDDGEQLVIRSIPVDDGSRLELRRRPGAGAAWLLVGEEEGEELEIPVPAAAALAGDEGGWWEVLQATRAELEFQDPTGTWTGRQDVVHPSKDPAVRELHEGWLATWAGMRKADEATPRPSVPAFGVLLVLDEARDGGESSLRLRVVSHGGACDHTATVAAVLRDVAARDGSTVAVLDSANGYVQLMDRKRLPTVYLEAADPGFQNDRPLTPGQLRRFAELGWTDPKDVPMPYESANYAGEWAGGNLAREWPRDGDPAELASVIVRTLEIYGLDHDAPLDVTIFPAVADQ